MITKYFFSIENPNLQYISIKAEIITKQEKTIIHLPSWRPGRYELGNFAKNVKGFKIFDLKGKKVNFQKITKDSWEVDTDGIEVLRVEYAYYANELNAGSTFLNADQLYVNPVNCCVYSEDTKEFPVEVKLNIPEHWMIAGSMKKEGTILKAENFEELADSPFIASEKIHYNQYEVGGTIFHLWLKGEVKPQWDKLIKDFKAFTEVQVQKFIEFPVSEYHFLFQIVPTKAYHGVEHQKSTVILLGPSYDIFKGVYTDLLGVSSHELYHTWNVKAIRPIEMYPYDYKKENYSKLGFICEGITTYMGDLMLYKSGVFNLNDYFIEMNAQLQKHFDNFGRFQYSVADSSFDTWLDGYVPGAPGRKVSIYTEGCLLAFVMDVKLLSASNNKYGLDTLMRKLYFDYALQNKGVSEEDFKKELEAMAGISFDDLFTDYIHGTRPFESILTEAFETIGLEMIHTPSVNYSMGRLGLKTLQNGNNFIVKQMYPGSPAELGGLILEDEIIAVNGYACAGNLENWLNYFDEDIKVLSFWRGGKLLEARLPEVNRNFFMEYKLKMIDSAELTHAQKLTFEAWKK